MLRRDFVRLVGGTSAALAFSPSLQASLLKSKYVDQIGLQLWTVRNQMKENQKETLKSIAAAGYKQVELGDILGSETIQSDAKELGLQVRSSFFNWEVICKSGEANVPSFEKVLEASTKAGLKHLVFGYIGKGSRETADQYKKWAEIANKAGEASKKAGIQLCYHNHSFEFAKLSDGSIGYEVFMKEFDPKNVHFEVDVFWVKIGGWDPIETMKKLKGRVSQVHLKDLKSGVGTIYDEGQVPADAFQELGDGVINMAEVLKVAEEIGAVECHVEQDQSPDPLASIRQSLQHINK